MEIQTATRELLTQAQLRELFEYLPNDGILICLKPSGRRKIGQRAGYMNHPDGRRRITIGRVRIYEANVIWCLVYGYWPKVEVDHIDRDPSNNRLNNLREATKQEQHVNRRYRNKTGYRGVFRKGSGFSAQITKDGKTTCLGTYKTPADAHAAYMKAAKELYGHFL